MREKQIRTAPLDIDSVAQVPQCDRRTFDMPAGPAVSQSALPRGLVSPFGLPEKTIKRILFAGTSWVGSDVSESRSPDRDALESTHRYLSSMQIRFQITS
jgi:hypothetical protein